MTGIMLLQVLKYLITRDHIPLVFFRSGSSSVSLEDDEILISVLC